VCSNCSPVRVKQEQQYISSSDIKTEHASAISHFSNESDNEGGESYDNPDIPEVVFEPSAEKDASAKENDMGIMDDGEDASQNCGIMFFRSSERRREMTSVRDKNPLQCDLCDRWFKYKPAMLAHRKLHESNILPDKSTYTSNPPRCLICYKGFKSLRMLQTHMIKHKNAMNGLAKQTGASKGTRHHAKKLEGNDDTEDDSAADDEDDDQDEQWEPNTSDKRKSAENGKSGMHTKKDTSQDSGTMFFTICERVRRGKKERGNPVQCDLCDRWFKYKQAMLSHRKLHEVDVLPDPSTYTCNPPRCLLCNKGFKSNWMLGIHMKKHKNLMDSASKLVEEATRDEELASNAKRGEEEGKEGAVQTRLRSQRSSGAENLDENDDDTEDAAAADDNDEDDQGVRESTENQAPLTNNEKEASQDSETVFFRSSERARGRKKSGREPVQCDLCDRWFKMKHFLIAHRKLHEIDVLPDKSFYTNNPPRCLICKKDFKSIWMLGVHMKKHKVRGLIASAAKAKEAKQKKKVNALAKGSEGDGQVEAVAVNTQEKKRELKLAQKGLALKHQCAVCKKRFICLAHLARHAERHDRSAGYPIYCDKCDRGFYTMREITGHLCGEESSFDSAFPESQPPMGNESVEDAALSQPQQQPPVVLQPVGDSACSELQQQQPDFSQAVAGSSMSIQNPAEHFDGQQDSRSSLATSNLAAEIATAVAAAASASVDAEMIDSKQEDPQAPVKVRKKPGPKPKPKPKGSELKEVDRPFKCSQCPATYM
jgi:hypothetical protein